MRGPCITESYYKEDKPAVDDEGYFDTGDVATIGTDGTMHITDRAKDIIKSGGEWISSIQIENIATGHPDVAEAAVIGMHHPKWEERPLLVVVAAKGKEPKRDEILSYLSDKIAKWWIPDDVQVVAEIPHTAAARSTSLDCASNSPIIGCRADLTTGETDTMRRLILEDPQSRAAVWSRNLAVFGLVVAIIGIGLARKGLDPKAALAVVGGALALRGSAFSARSSRWASSGSTATAGSASRSGGSCCQGSCSSTRPISRCTRAPFPCRRRLDDLATRHFSRKRYRTAGAFGCDAARCHERGGQSAAEEALSGPRTGSLDAEALDVEAMITKLIKKRHWQVVDEVRPIRFATGHIDVVVKSTLMGFPADLTVRIRGLGTHTQVDVRSVARGGWQEPGSNAARVRALIADIEAANDES